MKLNESNLYEAIIFQTTLFIAPKIISPRLDRELALVDDLLLLDRELAPVDDRELAPVDLLDRELAPVDDLLFSAPYALLISCIALFVPPLSG